MRRHGIRLGEFVMGSEDRRKKEIKKVGFLWDGPENLRLVQKSEQFSKRFYIFGGIFLLFILGLALIAEDYQGNNWRDLMSSLEFMVIGIAAVIVFIYGIFSRSRVYQMLLHRPNTVQEIWVERRAEIAILKFSLIYLHFVDNDDRRLGMFAGWMPLAPLLDEIKSVAPQAVMKEGVVKAKVGFRRFLDVALENTIENRLRIVFGFVITLISIFLAIFTDSYDGWNFLFYIVLWFTLQSMFIFLCIKFLKAMRGRRYGDKPPAQFNGTFAFIYSYIFVIVGVLLARHCIEKLRWSTFDGSHAGMAAASFVLLAIPVYLLYRYVTKPPAGVNTWR